jgi:HNH endonuclease
MRPQLLKQPTVRLHGEPYRDLRARVLRRDGGRCQMCGAATNLTVHHQQYRSHSGEDVEQNLITLCADCHSAVHALQGTGAWSNIQEVHIRSGLTVDMRVAYGIVSTPQTIGFRFRYLGQGSDIANGISNSMDVTWF